MNRQDYYAKAYEHPPTGPYLEIDSENIYMTRYEVKSTTG